MRRRTDFYIEAPESPIDPPSFPWKSFTIHRISLKEWLADQAFKHSDSNSSA